MPAGKEIKLTSPEPVIEKLEGGAGGVGRLVLKLKTVLSLGVATFLIVRKPLLGTKTQSAGAELGWPEGVVQTLIKVPGLPKSVRLTVQEATVSS